MVTALYRRYRPETFADLIGQAQVTDPLMTALRTNRVNHAYLFSGPRGCGKTTSARILARCLNCAEGPTDTPCGVCASCVDLSRDGSGSLDVVEIDAASHNGVDDARDLRERAIFAPARDRYKIFILDEAHMVTPQGFNALLKIVEEPPEHVKFIFATTEPDKVIGTIRSRTHHYPFRLIPPAQMLDYVQQLCESEHVGVEAGVLPLVVRAGGGSARDTLSLLDQLMAGSEGDSVDYERAVALLGYTHTALLDEVVDALAARDSGAAFSTVDRVIQTGQDPRRFVDDLLERLRDLIVVAATGENAAAVLRGLPQDELDKMLAQARAFGIAELSRTADVVNEALTQMTGATSPRLHLELMMARILVPAADDSARGALARVERLERRIGVDGAAAEGGQAAVSAQPVVADRAPAPAGAAPRARRRAPPRLPPRPPPRQHLWHPTVDRRRSPTTRRPPHRPPQPLASARSPCSTSATPGPRSWRRSRRPTARRG
ncbi:DNA polymerase III subunit gamma and tau [Plantibacter flavus]|uniref:DNA polymerase III subunit gamma and tau n=1 Tax=Plantibacter flavus TaxID=150123 RepID=UPI001F0B3567|nr:DNA polymerase III subunit gamma and tau [Plantibacter flavus]